MKKKLYGFMIVIISMIALLLTGCSVLEPKVDFEDVTLRYGEQVVLPLEVKGLLGTQTVEYSFSGAYISIEDGKLTALVAETTTVVTAKYGTTEAQFKVIVVLGDAQDNTGSGDSGSGNTGSGDTGSGDTGSGDTGNVEVDKGAMIIEAPDSIYSNYSGKEIKVTFTKQEYASDVTFTTNNENVIVKDGKIYATGIFESAVSVKVTAESEHHPAQTFTVSVSTYQGGIGVENKVQYYEQNIIKEENKGGIIFVGDSYFDGVPTNNGKPPFWSDFYEDYEGEKAFLLGISQSQIDQLEIVSERLVYPMEPSEIVVHIGFNDVHHSKKTVDALFARITALCEQYKERLPGVKIYFMGVEPKKNGYTEGTDYYASSTVKAPALTAMIKEYAEDKDWFTYLETMSVFVDSYGNIKQSSYLSTDLSHPTLSAYDEIREIINQTRDEVNSGGEQKPEGPIDYGTLTVEMPSSIYSNYPAKEIKIVFSKPEYSENIVYTTSNANVFVENGKIYAKGDFSESGESVIVTVTTEHHGTQTFSVTVSTYTGSINAESKVQYYEQNIIKEENKGGIIFVGDSYFDGVPTNNGKPPFWSDFYDDFPNEKAFLMGISQSQIRDLEIVSERIVYPMEPSEIVVHIGFNDVHSGSLTVDELFARIAALCEQYKERLPGVKIYFMGVEPKKNGYKEGTDYYTSSTVKAPALTAMIKEYAESKEWFTYVDTMPVFVENGVIKQSSYLSTDLSHPTLAAYDQIRAILNGVRGVENYVPPVIEDPTTLYINNLGINQDVNQTGKTYTDKNGNALTNNYIVSGVVTINEFNKSNAHLQFRFSKEYRFLIWDSNSDGKFGLGYLANSKRADDTTAGATVFDASAGLTIRFVVIVDNGKAYWIVNNSLAAVFEAPTLEYFNIGALQMNAVVSDIKLTVKAENETEYNNGMTYYNRIISPTQSSDEVLLKHYGFGGDINSSGKTFTAKDGSALQNNYVISGKLTVAALNKNNAHIQFRFSQKYRFLLWDSNSDGKFGVGYSSNGVNKNDNTNGAELIDANSMITLDWAIVVNNGKAYWYINGELKETFESPTLEYFKLGALQTDVLFYDIELTVKSENETKYNSLLTEYGVTN